MSPYVNTLSKGKREIAGKLDILLELVLIMKV
jgi:hypothetical protein